MKSLCLLLILFLCTCSPNGEASSPRDKEDQKEATTKEMNASVKVSVLPLGKINKTTVTKLYEQLQGIVPGTQLLRPEPMPGFAFYKPRNRYRADSLIGWLRDRAGKNEVYLAVTSQDISTTKDKNPDHGVMGLGFMPGKACIASEYRLRNKKNLFKVAIHELGHTTGLPHCPVKTCYMRDAEGGNPTDEETGFCPDCTRHLRKRGWRI